MSTWLAALALTLSLLAALMVLATRHANASVQCRRGVGLDGIERDFWSFSGGHDNTLIGRTIGKAYVTLTVWQFSRRQQHMRRKEDWN